MTTFAAPANATAAQRKAVKWANGNARHVARERKAKAQDYLVGELTQKLELAQAQAQQMQANVRHAINQGWENDAATMAADLVDVETRVALLTKALKAVS